MTDDEGGDGDGDSDDEDEEVEPRWRSSRIVESGRLSAKLFPLRLGVKRGSAEAAPEAAKMK